MTRTPTAAAQPGYTIRKHNRNWKVIDPAGGAGVHHPLQEGAKEVIRRLERLD